MSYTTNADKWYCCLNPAERAATQVCAANAGPLTYFVMKVLFDACFLLAVEGNASLRSEIFVENWGLTHGTVPPDDPEGIEVYYMNPDIWDDINAYFDLEGTTCSEPCKIRKFTN